MLDCAIISHHLSYFTDDHSSPKIILDNFEEKKIVTLMAAKKVFGLPAFRKLLARGDNHQMVQHHFETWNLWLGKTPFDITGDRKQI